MAVCLREGRKFYDYYQITREDETDELEELGADDEKELTNNYESSHSLFGIIWSIQKETGWTHDYILWGESWFNIQMKLADAPRMTSGSKARELKDDDELIKFINA